MQLDRLAVELRRRNGFESLDLGFAMLHAWHKPLLRAWCVTYWPVALLVSALLWRYPAVAFVVVWWVKPAFDRILLHVYAAAMFGTLPGVRDVLRALPSLLRRTRLAAGLTTYRLSMARSLFLPVWQLEGQRGAAAAARRRVLGARTYGYAAWLTFFCANLVGIWMVGGLAVIMMFLPREATQWFSMRDVFAWDAEWLVLRHALNLLGFVADTFIEPYFVGAGFSLYLNRRSELEGWDLEVEFRRMTQRYAASATPAVGPAVAPAMAIIALVVGFAVTPMDVHAADASAGRAHGVQAPSRIDALPLPPGLARDQAKAVLDDPVFGRKELRSEWVPRGSDAKRPEWLRAVLRWLRRIADALAEGGRVIVWILGGVVLAIAIVYLVRHRERWLRRRKVRAIPETLFGLDVRPASLPDDIVGAARAHLAAGNPAAALGLLYRGALSALIHFAAVDFHAGDTEGDCWRRASPVLSAGGNDYFRRLLDAWLRTAYAHRPPPRPELESLCDRWMQHFDRSALTPGATA